MLRKTVQYTILLLTTMLNLSCGDKGSSLPPLRPPAEIMGNFRARATALSQKIASPQTTSPQTTSPQQKDINPQYVYEHLQYEKAIRELVNNLASLATEATKNKAVGNELRNEMGYQLVTARNEILASFFPGGSAKNTQDVSEKWESEYMRQANELLWNVISYAGPQWLPKTKKLLKNIYEVYTQAISTAMKVGYGVDDYKPQPLKLMD